MLKSPIPLHRITQLLQEIKTHQSTTFGFRFTIPLIALPIFLLVMFQLGKNQTICSQMFTSKIGTIKNIQVLAPKNEKGLGDNLLSHIPFIPQKQTELVLENRSLLISSQSEPPLTILPDKNLNLNIFEEQNVILTGTLSDCARTITLDSFQNLSILK